MAAGLTAFGPARADETIAYTYDARGRVTQVAHSGTVNSGVTANYGYDKADNRTNVTVTTPPPAAPSFAISDTSVAEGGDLIFTVTRTGSSAGSYTVNYASSDNNAKVSNLDYWTTTGTLTFAAGEMTKTIKVPSFVDSVNDPNETMYMDISSPSGGATITRSRAVGTII